MLKGVVPGRVKGRRTRQLIDSFRFRLVDVRYPLLYFLARKITRCNIAHLYFLARRITSTRCNIAHIYRFRFGWSMCDIRFCISWPEKSQDAYRTSRSIPFRLVDVRYSGLYFLARKITRCNIAHLVPFRFDWSMCDIRFCISRPEKSQDVISHIPFRLVDVRCPRQVVLKADVPGRVKGRRTRSC